MLVLQDYSSLIYINSAIVNSAESADKTVMSNRTGLLRHMRLMSVGTNICTFLLFV
jgi:hypothetical protein